MTELDDSVRLATEDELRGLYPEFELGAVPPFGGDTIWANSALAYATLHPMGRMGEVEEIVHAALYLETAAFVTGETLHVDGGQSAGH